MPQAAVTPSELVQGEIEEVERVLRGASASEIELLQEGALHILGAGGKRLRPQLLLLSTLAAGGSLARAVPLAAACELVHTATLVHDDIVDESDSRRGRTAVQFYIGNSASVLMGDYLVIRAFGLATDDPDRRVWRILVETIARMCEGEVLQICVKGDTSIRLEVYEKIIECKTALLMEACARFGALLGAVDRETEEALAGFGHAVGMAFQVQDDVLDFLGDEQALGKPVGGDLREGKVTLPVLFALEGAADADRRELLHLFEKPGPLTAAEVCRATGIIEAAGGFERARGHAREYIRRAKRRLERTPPGCAREALLSLADRIVDRHR